MTKSFRETMKENNAKFKKDLKVGNEEIRAQTAEKEERAQQKKTDKEKAKPQQVDTETKTFKEIRDDLKRDKSNLKAEYKEKKEMNNVELAASQTVRPAGLNRTGNVLAKGFALWLAIPAIVVILIIGLFAGVGLWDWFTGLFN